MKNSELRSLARETYKKNVAPICLANACSFGAQVIAALIPFGLGTILLSPVIEYYECSMALDIARGTHEGVTSPLRKIPLLKTYGTVLLSSILIIIGLLLLVVPGIALATCFPTMLFILKDYKDMPVLEVMKTTWQTMKGFKFQVFRNSFLLWLSLVAIEIPYGLIIVLAGRLGPHMAPAMVTAIGIGLMVYTTLALLTLIFVLMPKYHLTLAHLYEQNIKPQIKGDK